VKNLAIVLLLAVIVVMLIALVAIVTELSKAQNSIRVIERVIEVIEVPSKFVYYSSTELNEEVQKMIEGGGMLELLDFFTYYTNNIHVSTTILEESLDQQIPITLAFSLAWGESRFRTQLVNRNGGHSSDWGLFQLNDGHRNWTREEYFDIRKNTKEGLNYFSYSLYTFDSDLALSIAGYNKGVENVKNGSLISYRTLVHINNIIEYDRVLEVSLNRFINRWNNER